MTDFKETLTKVVVSEINRKKTNMVRGTKIATNTRIIPIIVIEPFSK